MSCETRETITHTFEIERVSHIWAFAPVKVSSIIYLVKPITTIQRKYYLLNGLRRYKLSWGSGSSLNGNQIKRLFAGSDTFGTIILIIFIFPLQGWPGRTRLGIPRILVFPRYGHFSKKSCLLQIYLNVLVICVPWGTTTASGGKYSYNQH
jgi:hypothetical protein